MAGQPAVYRRMNERIVCTAGQPAVYRRMLWARELSGAVPKPLQHLRTGRLIGLSREYTRAACV
eukprot:8236861-Pyramimonas_sp.AAC.1